MTARLAFFTLTTAFLSLPLNGLTAEPLAEDVELAAEIEREQKIAERFLSLLERNPREGTSLDRAYGFFVEQGKLDELVANYRARVDKDAADGAAWLILGLIEARRGNDAEAIEAFKQASEQRREDPMAAYYLGHAYAIAGRPQLAIEAFEQAVARKPQRADLPPIFAELGRLHQRAGRQEDASKVWDRLEAAFSGDLRVKAEIAAILEQEGQPELALQRYEALANAAEDDYRRVSYSMKAAGLKARLSKDAEAIAAFEALLASLNPDNWLYREVRRGLEDVFLRTDDVEGLATYYEKWIEQHPEDVQAMTRLAALLGDLGRSQDARSWFDKAVKLAPSDVRLRRAYIESLRSAGQAKVAIAQFEVLNKVAPNDPDVVREWGTVYLEDKSLPEEERRQKASTVWKQLLATRKDDPVITAQIADWLRQADANEDALALYRKAVEQAPDDPRYLEYLGEYQHQLGDKDAAVTTWKRLAADKNRNAENLVRLAEIFAGFGYKTEALETYRDADTFDLEFGDHIRFAKLLREQELYDESRQQIEMASQIAESDEERQNALLARIETDDAAGILQERIDELQKLGETEPTSDHLLTLALYLNAAGDRAGAVDAAQKAVELNPRSIPAQATLAKLAESSGQFVAAVEAFQRLAALDRRGRTEYLKQTAELEQRLGRSEEALATAREVLASAPGNPDAFSFYAQLCFRLGENEEGLDALRRASRLAPSDPGPLLNLAAALADQFRTPEAIELYWQAYERSESLDDKSPIVSRLAELYLRSNRFEDLIKRLQQDGGEADRECRLLIAEAHQAVSDLGRARETLESLLPESRRDTQLLSRLVQLCERDRDFETALKYQREIVELAPEDRNEKSHLARLYLESDDSNAGSEFWNELVQEGLDQTEALSLFDALLGAEKYGEAVRLIDRRLRTSPDDWELLYRRAFALAMAKEQREAATEAFERLLALELSEETESARTKALKKRMASYNTRQSPIADPLASYPKIMQRSNDAYQILNVFGIARQGGVIRSSGRSLSWTPSDYGAARIAALTWLSHKAALDKGDALVNYAQWLRQQAVADGASVRSKKDWYYSTIADARLRPGSSSTALEAAKLLAKTGDEDGAWAYLMQVSQDQSRRTSPSLPTQPKAEPLKEAELDLLLRCFEQVRHQTSGPYTGYVAATVARELSLAGRREEAHQLVREALASSDGPQLATSLISAANGTEDLEVVNEVFDKLESLPPNQLTSMRGLGNSLAKLMRSLWDADQRDVAMQLFDRQLDIAARRLTANQNSPTRSPTSSVNYGITIYHQNGVGQTMVVNSSIFNRYLEIDELTLIRNFYEFHDGANAVADLVAHLEKRAENSEGQARALNYLALACVHRIANGTFDRSASSVGRPVNRSYFGVTQTGDGDSAKADEIAATEKALAAAPDDHDLRLTLARLLIEQNESERALAVLDQVEPFEIDQLRARELAVLPLAAKVSKQHRARQAAERLFGMQLDDQSQFLLANVMQQIGMHDEAEAVLGRLRSRSRGGSTNTQIELLRHYKSLGKKEIAAEIARDIVRRTKVRTSTSGARTIEDVHREEAVRYLKETGQLEELIENAKRQARRSPGSVEAQRLLAELYAAAGKQDEAVEVLKTLRSHRPADADLQFQLAERMSAMGKSADAIELYKAAIKAKPDLVSHNFYSFANQFERANKRGELLSLIEELEVGGNGVPIHYVMNSISNAFNDQTQTERALRTFDSLWKKNPSERGQMLQYMYNPQAWKNPKLAAYALELLKADGAQLDWAQITNSVTLSSNGRIRTLLSNLVAACKAEKSATEFKDAIEKTLSSKPDWGPGIAMLAIIDAEAGRTKEAKDRLSSLLDETKPPLPGRAAWSLAVELESYDALRDLCLRFGEHAVESGENVTHDYQFTPQAFLVGIYGKVGRNDEARKILLSKALDVSGIGQYSDPSYQLIAEMRHYIAVAKQLDEVGFPLDAIAVLDRFALTPERVNAAKQRSSYEVDQASQTRKKLVEAITPQATAAYVAAAAKAGTPTSKSTSPPMFDLFLTVSGTEFQEMTVNSVIATVLVETLGKESPANKNSPEIREIKPPSATLPSQQAPGTAPATAKKDPASAQRLVEDLEAVRKQRPNDVSVEILTALAGFATGDLETARQSVEQAQNLLKDQSADDQNSESASTMLALWIVAREAQEHGETRALAAALEEKSLEAARRLNDNRWVVAMLRERGQRALDRGDKTAAEAAWSDALGLLIPPAKPGPEKSAEPPHKNQRSDAPTANPRKMSAIMPAGIMSAAALSLVAQAGASSASADRPSSAPAVQIASALQALELAELAAKNGMLELSFEAVRTSLGRGRPIDMDFDGINRSHFTAAGIVQNASESAINRMDVQIITRLKRIDTVWEEKHADPTGAYEALAAAVLPASRDSEAFMYLRPIQNSISDTPDSGARLLVQWSRKAGTLDDLDKRVAERSLESTTDGLVLAALVAYENDDAAAANRALESLVAKMVKGSARDAELLCHAALPGMKRTETAKAAALALSEALSHYRTTRSDQPLRQLVMRVATFELEHGQADTAEKQLNRYLTSLTEIYSNYPADYSIQRRRDSLLEVAHLLARHGRGTSALSKLMEANGLPQTRSSRSAPSSLFEVSLARSLATDRSEAAYRQLFDWTFPKDITQPVRVMSSLNPGEVPPSEFAVAADPTAEIFPAQVSLATSTACALLALAKHNDKLDEIVAEADRRLDQKQSNAAELSILAHVAAGKGREASETLERLVAEVSKENVNSTGVTERYPLLVIVGHAAAGVPELREPAKKLGETISAKTRNNSHILSAAGQVIVLEAEAFAAGIEPRGTLYRDHFGDWRVARMPRAQDRKLPRTPAVWTTSDGIARHAAGSEADPLVFRYPLTGSFDIVAETYDSNYAEAHVGFSGLTFEPYAWSQKSGVFEIGRYGQGERAIAGVQKNAFNEVRIENRPSQIRCLVNGEVLYEGDGPSAASPFLVLSALFSRQTAYRNVRIEGNPVIPSEVHLVNGERLDGWTEIFFGESKTARPGTDKPRDENPRQEHPTWSVSGGVVTASASNPRTRQSYIYHHRPLWDGEAIEYEFFHSSTHSDASPTLGRLAFLIEQNGVDLHWITDENGEGDWTGLGVDNSIDVPQYRTGSDALPLKTDDWNKVRLSIDQSTMRIELNEREVFQRPLGENDNRLFGFFTKTDKPTLIRNVVLTGDWPDKLDETTKTDLIRAIPPSEDPMLKAFERNSISRFELKVKSGPTEATQAEPVAPGD